VAVHAKLIKLIDLLGVYLPLTLIGGG